MPKAVTCKLNDQYISIDEALAIRDRKSKVLFRCVECSQQVRAHKMEQRSRPPTLNTWSQILSAA